MRTMNFNPNAQSTYVDATSHTSRKLPNTETMVNEALHATQKIRKGISIQKLKKTICQNYNFDEFSPQRMARLKRIVRSLLEDKTIYNTSGKGLNGCIKLSSASRRRNAPNNNNPQQRTQSNSLKTPQNSTVMVNLANVQHKPIRRAAKDKKAALDSVTPNQSRGRRTRRILLSKEY